MRTIVQSVSDVLRGAQKISRRVEAVRALRLLLLEGEGEDAEQGSRRKHVAEIEGDMELSNNIIKWIMPLLNHEAVIVYENEPNDALNASEEKKDEDSDASDSSSSLSHSQPVKEGLLSSIGAHQRSGSIALSRPQAKNRDSDSVQGDVLGLGRGRTRSLLMTHHQRHSSETNLSLLSPRNRNDGANANVSAQSIAQRRLSQNQSPIINESESSRRRSGTDAGNGDDVVESQSNVRLNQTQSRKRVNTNTNANSSSTSNGKGDNGNGNEMQMQMPTFFQETTVECAWRHQEVLSLLFLLFELFPSLSLEEAAWRYDLGGLLVSLIEHAPVGSLSQKGNPVLIQACKLLRGVIAKSPQHLSEIRATNEICTIITRCLERDPERGAGESGKELILLAKSIVEGNEGASEFFGSRQMIANLLTIARTTTHPHTLLATLDILVSLIRASSYVRQLFISSRSGLSLMFELLTPPSRMCSLSLLRQMTLTLAAEMERARSRNMSRKKEVGVDSRNDDTRNRDMYSATASGTGPSPLLAFVLQDTVSSTPHTLHTMPSIPSSASSSSATHSQPQSHSLSHHALLFRAIVTCGLEMLGGLVCDSNEKIWQSLKNSSAVSRLLDLCQGDMLGRTTYPKYALYILHNALRYDPTGDILFEFCEGDGPRITHNVFLNALSSIDKDVKSRTTLRMIGLDLERKPMKSGESDGGDKGKGKGQGDEEHDKDNNRGKNELISAALDLLSWLVSQSTSQSDPAQFRRLWFEWKKVDMIGNVSRLLRLNLKDSDSDSMYDGAKASASMLFGLLCKAESKLSTDIRNTGALASMIAIVSDGKTLSAQLRGVIGLYSTCVVDSESLQKVKVGLDPQSIVNLVNQSQSQSHSSVDSIAMEKEKEKERLPQSDANISASAFSSALHLLMAIGQLGKEAEECSRFLCFYDMINICVHSLSQSSLLTNEEDEEYENEQKCDEIRHISACKALRLIAKGSDVQKVDIITAGGVSCLMNVCNSTKSDLVNVHCLSVLSELLSSNAPSIISAIVKRGGVELMMNVIKSECMTSASSRNRRERGRLSVSVSRSSQLQSSDIDRDRDKDKDESEALPGTRFALVCLIGLIVNNKTGREKAWQIFGDSIIQSCWKLALSRGYNDLAELADLCYRALGVRPMNFLNPDSGLSPSSRAKAKALQVSDDSLLVLDHTRQRRKRKGRKKKLKKPQ